MAQLMTNVRTANAEPADLLAAVGGLAEWSASSATTRAEPSDASYLDRYLDGLEQLSELAGELGYGGLQGACMLVQQNVEGLRDQDRALEPRVRNALDTWPILVQRYLELPTESGAGEAIANHLQLPFWVSPLDPLDAEVLQSVLVDDRGQAATDIGSAHLSGAASGRVADQPWNEKGTEVAAPAEDPPADTPASGANERESHEAAPVSARDLDEPTEGGLPPQVMELVTVLLEELPLMDEPLQSLLQLEAFAEEAPPGRAEACELYADYLERFADAAEVVGLSGLQQVVASMRANLALLEARPRAFTPAEMALLAEWSCHASVYLSSPHDRAACQGLIHWLQSPDWPEPLAADQAQPLLGLLQAPSLLDAELQEETEARAVQAAPEDVSLALPNDVNPELLEALLLELPVQTQTFSEAIQNLIAGGSLDDVTVAQRTAHTLKGAGNTVGVTGLATLTHHLEDILVALVKHKALPTPALSLSLMSAADCLEAMGEALCGMGDVPDNAQEVLQEVLGWANRIDLEGLPQADDRPFPLSATPGAAEPLAEVAPHKPQGQAQSPAARKKVAMELVDDLLRLGGETIILSGQVHEQVRRIDERMRAMQAELDRLQRLGGELERLIDIKDFSTDRRSQQRYAELDALEMDQYSELHTTGRMLVEAATDARQIGGMVGEQLRRLDQVLITQERLNRQTQETVLRARMVPINTQVSRLQRSVRQTCRLTGKQAQLHVGGADTLMDGEVLSELTDPLMHVLRNAVDHGIELPAQRVAAGKPQEGNIWLDFGREGNNILVHCRDDGAGFDFAAIRRAAEGRGLLEAGQSLSDEELTSLALLPSFSTRSEVTQTSGRGVGLDVVHSHVLRHGGSLSLKSAVGEGSTTELRIPVSLISTHALLVRLRGQMVAIANRGIEQILHAADGTERSFGDQTVFQVGEQMYPLKHLDELLGLVPDRRTKERTSMAVLLVKDRSGITAVRVQEVCAGTDLVVKGLGRYIPRLPGIVGATILGDGAVAPVLDLPELMSVARGAPKQVASPAVTEADQDSHRLPLALVVDDSLSARRALAQVMEDAGYDVRAARDGLEAVEIAQGARPDIVLADMEMPHMNGIELTSHLRACPETADLPVIMITSRSSAKHRRQAEEAGVNVYLTKPFLDDELLDHVTALRGQP